MKVLLLIFTLFFISVAGLTAFLYWSSKKSLLPKDAAIGCVVSRNVETVLFSLTLLIIFIYLLTQRDGGLLLMLDELRPQFTAVYLVLAGIVLLLLVGTVVMTFLRRTAWAVCIASIVLYIYAVILYGPFDLMERIVNLCAWS